jgi:hypothetical protein
MIFALTPLTHQRSSPSFVIDILIHKATPRASAPLQCRLEAWIRPSIYTLLSDTDTLAHRLTREERILDKGVRLRITWE